MVHRTLSFNFVKDRLLFVFKSCIPPRHPAAPCCGNRSHPAAPKKKHLRKMSASSYACRHSYAYEVSDAVWGFASRRKNIIQELLLYEI
jgi:hypothetical protein